MYDAGVRLRHRGVDVRLLTTTPRGVTARRVVDGLPVRYVRTPVPRWLTRRGGDVEVAFGAVAAAGALLGRADLVHAWLYPDAYGAGLAHRIRSRPLVLKLTGTVRPERIAREPLKERLFRGALAAADEVWCNSAFARDEMAGFDVPMQVVPAGVDTDRFMPGGTRAPVPTLLCTSAPDEPRKRLVDVIDAWPQVLAARPDAALRLAGHASPATRLQLLDRLPAAARPSVTFLGLLDHDALVAAYRSAWVVLAPAVYEALGLTTLEALACGTPVVGADSGATAELLADPAVGVPFAPADPDDAARAMLEGLGLKDTPGIVEACRQVAEGYAWNPIVDDITRRYRRLLDASR